MSPSPSIAPDSVASARLRAGIAIGAGILVAIITTLAGHWSLAPLMGWDTAALIYVSWILLTIRKFDSQQTAELASREDPGRGTTDGLLLVASLASLLAVGFLILQSGNSQGTEKLVKIGLGVISVILSWSVVHTLYTLHYARLYYSKQKGGIDFNGEEAPSYIDFAYLAFTIGMTFQVSDTSLKTREFRAAALRHSLLSYLFGTVIVATTINLIAGLGK